MALKFPLIYHNKYFTFNQHNLSKLFFIICDKSHKIVCWLKTRLSSNEKKLKNIERWESSTFYHRALVKNMTLQTSILFLRWGQEGIKYSHIIMIHSKCKNSTQYHSMIMNMHIYTMLAKYNLKWQLLSCLTLLPQGISPAFNNSHHILTLHDINK